MKESSREDCSEKTGQVSTPVSGQTLVDLFRHAPAQKIVSRSWSKRAAVNLIFDSIELASASLLMIQRASYQGDPWSGHMAFPGGRQEKVDHSTRDTARRETFEELGFNINESQRQQISDRFLGRLSDRYARQRGRPLHLVITPYVYALSGRPALQMNYEVAATFWIPFRYFSDFENRKRFQFHFGSQQIDLPCYQFGEHQRVWGLSLEMIDELMRWQGLSIPATPSLEHLDE